MATQGHRPSINGVTPRKPTTPRAAPAKRPSVGGARQAVNGAPRPAPQRAAPVAKKAQSVAGELPSSGGGGGGVGSAYSIMASRIANRVAEMAESITFVEKPKPMEMPRESEEKRRPRKLEMRLENGGSQQVAFSAPFLDNTLQKMLLLQNRMLKTTADLSKAEGVDEKTIKEHAAQSAELSRIIAMICAEKARQGA